MKRGEIWWADLGPHRPQEQTGRRPVILWQSDALTGILESVLVIPLTTNLDRANLAGTAVIESREGSPPETSIALAFQMRAIPKTRLASRLRALTDEELAELELATDEHSAVSNRIRVLANRSNRRPAEPRVSSG